jgi:hypothetical protein
MLSIKICAVVLSLYYSSFSQADKDHLPEPIDGWEKFQTRIRYDVLANRAGIEGAYRVRIYFDSTGNVKKKEFYSLNSYGTLTHADSLFWPAIVEAISAQPWRPASRSGLPISSAISFPIIFYLDINQVFDSHPLIIVDTIFVSPKPHQIH